MTAIETAIDLAAKPSEVWAVLTDFDRYNTWNPFITKVEGEPKLGSHVKVHVGIGQAAVPIEAEIVTFRPDQKLVWRSKLFVPGLFDRDHSFEIEPTDTGCTLTQTQTYMGPIAPAAGVLTSEVVRRGLKSMNEALKRRVERIHNT